MKGICAKGCEKTWFQKGHIPENAKPMGNERINKEGYIEIKIRERRTKEKPNTYALKQRVIWEKAYGEIPPGHVIIFKDGNKLNCELSNLAIVSRAELLQMTRKNLRYADQQLTETGILIARAGILSGKAKQNKRR